MEGVLFNMVTGQWEDICHGSVEQAVALSLQQDRPLLVILTKGDNEGRFMALMDRQDRIRLTGVGNNDGLLSFSKEPRVLDLIKQNTVPLQVTEGSKDYGFFSQVFPVKAVPSIYVIKQSQVLDVFTEDLPLEAFIERFERSLGLGGNQQHQREPADAAAVDSDPQTSRDQQTEASPVNAETSKPENAENQTSNATSHTTNPTSTANTVNKPTASSNKDSSGSHSSVSAVTSERVKGKTANRDEHKKSESEKYQERVRRERQAEAEERKRILKLVETDRQERKRAAQRAKNQSGSETATATQQDQQKTTMNSKPRAFSNSTECALSIRLFDGRALKHRFSSSDTLQQVREWVDTNRTDGDQPYTFFQTIPKKTFGAGEEQYTLRQLELTPSSTLILKPISNYSTAYSASASTYSPTAMLQRGTRAVGEALYTFLGLGYDPHSPYSSEESSRSSSPVSTADNTAPAPNFRTINNPNDDRTTYNGNQLSLKDDHRKDA